MYNAIKYSFHLEDNSLYTQEGFSKMHTFINALNKKFCENYTLEQNVSIHENIIPFRGNAGLICQAK